MKNKFYTVLFLFVLLVCFQAGAQSFIKMTAPGGPAGIGPVYSAQVVAMTDPTTGTFYSPPVTVTYTLSNQQFGPGNVEGVPTESGESFGGGLNNTANSPMIGTGLYSPMDKVANPTNNMFTSCNVCTPGTGVNVSTDYAVNIFNCADALIDANSGNLFALNDRVYFCDLTITFNRPVSNPVLQLNGMGGYTTFKHANKWYELGYATEFDMASPGLSFRKLSGNFALAVTPAQINNIARWFGNSATGAILNGITRYASSGSVVIAGTNITTVTIRVYLHGDNGRISNGKVSVLPDPGVTPIWGSGTNNPTGVPGTISGDLFLLGITLRKPVTISGNVFNDPDAGKVNNSTGASNLIPTGIYANLTDANGKVVATMPIPVNGGYSFPAIFDGTYTVSTSTNAGVQGLDAPLASLPTGWINTGEFNGLPNTGNDGNINGASVAFTVNGVNINNINFGIERLPESAVNIESGGFNPGGIISIPVNASWFVTSNVGNNPNTLDYDGGKVNSIRITAFPQNITSITINGIIYTSASWPGAGITIPYKTAVGPTLPIAVDPVDGNVNIIIPFAAIDNAQQEDATPGSVTIFFNAVLPIRLVSFSATLKEKEVQLHWVVSEETNLSHYEVEAGNDGAHFHKIGILNADNSGQYYYTDNNTFSGINYYRLASLDIDGTKSYSNICKVDLNKTGMISISPNPAIGNVYIALDGQWNNKKIDLRVFGMEGKLVYRRTIPSGSSHQDIDISQWKAGSYIFYFTAGNVSQQLPVLVLRRY